MHQANQRKMLMQESPPVAIAKQQQQENPAPATMEQQRQVATPAGKSTVCDSGAKAAPVNLANSDNENSTNSTWSNSQGSRAASKRMDASQKLNLILPAQSQQQKGCLYTPVIVTSDQVASGNQFHQLAAGGNSGFAANASSQLLLDSFAHLNNQGEVSLFTGLPSCTPASADRLAASGINPFFWGTTATISHPAVQTCEQATIGSNAGDLQARQQQQASSSSQQNHPQDPTNQQQSNEYKTTNIQHNTQQQQQQQQQQQHREQYQQQHKKLMLANLQAASGLSPLVLSPLSLLGLSPEQEAWLRFGYVSPNQHPLAGKSFTQTDLNQQHQFNLYAQTMNNQYHHHNQQQQQQQQQQQLPDMSNLVAAQDLTSTSSNHPVVSAQQQAAYVRDSCIQYEGGAQNPMMQQQQHHQQLQQQQQQVPQTRVSQAQQFASKISVPTFQISDVNQLPEQQQPHPSQHDGQRFSAPAQLPPSAARSAVSPAQSQFVYHQGPMRYTPTSSQVNGVQAGVTSQVVPYQQAPVIQRPHQQQPQTRPNFVSTSNVISHIVRPSSSDLYSSTGLPQGGTPTRQESLPPQPAGHPTFQGGQLVAVQSQPLMSRENLAANSGLFTAGVGFGASSSGRNSPNSSDNDHTSVSTTNSQLAERTGSSLSSSSRSSMSDGSDNPTRQQQVAVPKSSIVKTGTANSSVGKSRPTSKQAKCSNATTTTKESHPKVATCITDNRVVMSTNENGELVPVKKKSRGGRKKKLVTHEEMIARKNRSKERNRVAARRCRQKRKQFLDELRDKIHELNNLAQKLQKENSTLKSELELFKKRHSACTL